MGEHKREMEEISTSCTSCVMFRFRVEGAQLQSAERIQVGLSFFEQVYAGFSPFIL